MDRIELLRKLIEREPLVRWSATASDDALRTFADYLAERVELLRG